MSTETELSEAFEKILAEIFTLDHQFYVNPDRTRADYAAYAARREELELLRDAFYRNPLRSDRTAHEA